MPKVEPFHEGQINFAAVREPVDAPESQKNVRVSVRLYGLLYVGFYAIRRKIKIKRNCIDFFRKKYYYMWECSFAALCL